MKEDADIQSFSQFLSGRNMFTIIRKNHRKPGYRISANPSRYIQVAFNKSPLLRLLKQCNHPASYCENSFVQLSAETWE